jgi:malate dehydrogenase (oxaloacetate-decarboxylating)
MPIPSSSWSITMRVHLGADPLDIGRITTAVGEAGGTVVGVDIVESHPDLLVVDLTCNAADAAHAEAITDAVEAVEGAHVHTVSDRTFLLHLGGKLEVASKVPLRTRDDLSMAYTPGVARVCLAIAEHPEDARKLTIKRNTVAVVTDGSAVLGLGNIGPAAALPVMEGKALLFKQFAGVDAWPVCLDTQDTDEIVRAVELLAPAYGGVNLEDIAAPRCFEVERRLRSSLDIPVFHDDQHGTAIVVLAALRNALRVVGKTLPDVRVVLSGTGAAGVAIIKILQAEGAGEIVACDRVGILHPGRAGLDESKRWVAEHTNPHRRQGSLREAIVGADVFIGVSGPNVLDPDDIATVADGAIVFALANPDPEVDPAGARRHAAVVATGRSDEPNQINNVLAFPGVFRGALDAEAREISESMKVAAARAIAGRVHDDELRPDYIVPSVFDRGVAPAVADAVRQAAEAERRGSGGLRASPPVDGGSGGRKDSPPADGGSGGG